MKAEEWVESLQNLDIDYVAMIETGALLLIALYIVSRIVKILMSGLDVSATHHPKKNHPCMHHHIQFFRRAIAFPRHFVYRSTGP